MISDNSRIVIAFFGMCCLGCENTPVTLLDCDPTPPVITLSNFGVGGTHVNVDPLSSDVAGNQTAPVEGPCGKIPEVLILGNATDPDAVRSLEVTVTDSAAPSSSLYHFEMTQDPDSSNQAFTRLDILGANGDSGDPMIVSFGNGTCPQDKSFHVSATSSNFSGVVSKLDYDLVLIRVPSCECD